MGTVIEDGDVSAGMDQVLNGLHPSDERHPYVAVNPVMLRLRAQIDQVAGLDIPVLLLGESGVGKDVSARLIHQLSSRSARTFLKVNCAALPADLLESELFGYEPGAFTGAQKAKPGKFELCNKGTMFLDEIGEMPVSMQAKLLQVLEDRQFSRLGGRSLITVDVRILAATNVDIEKALASGQMRRDLYYRLSVFPLLLPPLRERREEICPLLQYFLKYWSERMARTARPFSPQVLRACQEYGWPGNIRELENFVKRYIVLDDEQSALDELTMQKRDHNGAVDIAMMPELETNTLLHQGCSDLKAMVRDLKAVAEKKAIRHVLEQTGGDRKQTAELLGISSKALLSKMRKYSMVEPETVQNCDLEEIVAQAMPVERNGMKVGRVLQASMVHRER